MTSDDPSGPDFAPGDLVRWTIPARLTKPLRIVLAPVSEDTTYVRMADRDGDTDLEVLVARREATGVRAPQLVLESFEPVQDGDPALTAFLREQGARFGAADKQ